MYKCIWSSDQKELTKGHTIWHLGKNIFSPLFVLALVIRMHRLPVHHTPTLTDTKLPSRLLSDYFHTWKNNTFHISTVILVLKKRQTSNMQLTYIYVYIYVWQFCFKVGYTTVLENTDYFQTAKWQDLQLQFKAYQHILKLRNRQNSNAVHSLTFNLFF